MASTGYLTLTPTPSQQSQLTAFTPTTPISRQAKRKISRRPRRSTIEKPQIQTIHTEYNNILFPKNTNQTKTHTKAVSNRLTDIQKVLVTTKLIEFSCPNPHIQTLIAALLSNAWFTPNQTYNHKSKKKSKNHTHNTYQCKIHSHITCVGLSQCLNYTFQEFMAFEWAKQLYFVLMQQLSLPQQCLLFSIGAYKKNNDCIIGKEGIDWMLHNHMCKTRSEAITLGKTMQKQGYLCNVSSTHDFEDNNLWYYCNENMINSALTQTVQTNNDFIMDRLPKHNEIMQCLVSLILIEGFDANNIKISDFLKDIQLFFDMPMDLDTNNAPNNKYICRIVDYVSFDHWHECIEFILTEFWEESVTQNIYFKLRTSLTIAQKCKLMSIGLATHLKKYRLKKYKNCFVGPMAIDWVTNITYLEPNVTNGIHLMNVFLEKRLIKSLSNPNASHTFENENNAFYMFDMGEIENQTTNSMANKRKISKFSPDLLHGRIVQNLIEMTMSHSVEIELLLDLSKAFYLPRNGAQTLLNSKNSKFINKCDENIIFHNVIDTLHYILIENFSENYAQIIYRKLFAKLSLTQSAKLFSLGIERKTRKKHFKKYKDCFVGTAAFEWLVNQGFCNDFSECIHLGNQWLTKGYISEINNNTNTFKNEAIFYTFNDIEINKQCITESYQNNNIPKTLLSPCTHTLDLLSPCTQCTENMFSSESPNNNFFNDIDYIFSDNDMDSQVSNEQSLQSLLEFEKVSINRTKPLKIQTKLSKVDSMSHIAVHNGFEDSDGDIGKDFTLFSLDLVTSQTENTPEPCVEFEESLVQRRHNKCVATRITHDLSSLDLNINKENMNYNKANLKVRSMSRTSNTSTSSMNSRRSLTHERYLSTDGIANFDQFETAVPSVFVPIETLLFESDQSFNDITTANDMTHFEHISTSVNSNLFTVSYPKYTPKQIGL